MDTLQFLKLKIAFAVSDCPIFLTIIHFNGNHHYYMKILFIKIEKGTIVKKPKHHNQKNP